MKQKLLIKVIDGDEWKWVHLCHIDSRMYQKFKAIPEYEGLSIGSHISAWLLQDFGVKMPMAYRREILQLKNLLETWYRREYPELYLKYCPGDKQRISSLVSLWLTQHMQYELEKRKGDSK